MAEKITDLAQVKMILQRMLDLMESDSKNEEEVVDNKEEENTEKSGNVIDKLISTIHSNFTQYADTMYGDGVFTQEDRIALSGAIGAALDVFNEQVKQLVPHLYTTDPYPMYKADEVEFSTNTELLSKSNDEERVAYSIAYPVMPDGWYDSQSDKISELDIRKMSHNWMINSTRYDIHHKELNVSKDDAVVVESFIAPVDIDWPLGNNTYKKINKGSWIVATKFSEPMFRRVKSGEINAYSIRGKAKRIKITN